ncbi:MAG: hypothetical protein CVU31_07555 [Betaproteobacteria bacterium HGW-Betaproteobacteria-4]|jgi:N-acyl-D-aspartate/D-glutamate deacylase|nr:MAG: hypothetical protein CVU31_07555 [Betaproteobacteria bacterium HGW-Betaproteobacteria-4]
MNKLVAILAVSLFSAIATPSVAGPATEALSVCLADNTTGKDRKDMARWVFIGMSTHPEIQSLSNVTQADRETLDQQMAAMITRLITENCTAQVKLARNKDGSNALKDAFEIIGKLAMQELMSNPNVNSAFTTFTKYVDQNKFSAVFAE